MYQSCISLSLSLYIYIYIWRFPKWEYPYINYFHGIFHYKPTILGILSYSLALFTNFSLPAGYHPSSWLRTSTGAGWPSTHQPITIIIIINIITCQLSISWTQKIKNETLWREQQPDHPKTGQRAHSSGNWTRDFSGYAGLHQVCPIKIVSVCTGSIGASQW